jgi:ribonuclease R
MARRPKQVVSPAGQEPAATPALSKAENRVLDALRRARQPLGWPALRDALNIKRGTQADDLRRLLRDMCRSGHLYLDEDGAYHSVAAGGALEGTLRPAGPDRRSLVLETAGERWPVRQTGRSQLRAGDRVRARQIAGQAFVTDVVDYAEEPIIGRLVADPKGWYLISESPTYRGRVYLKKRKGGFRDGDTLAVRVSGAEAFGLTGEIVQKVAARDDLHVASSTLLQAYKVPVGWSPEVDDQVAALPKTVEAREAKGRTDLRKLPLVTIDGADARDFDDAVYCEKRRMGGWRLVVAIADVAHYVKPQSPLDRDGQDRGNSVYLPDRVVPMLPEALSNELCSLKPQVDRLCMVCDMRISARGRITKFEFYEGIMHSQQRLTYDEVAAFVADDGTELREGLELSKEVRRSLQALHQVYEVLRDEREARGALDFDTHELRLVMENGLVEQIVPVQRNDAHMMIEEAMISANVCAARFLEKYERLSLYRVHEGPVGEKMENLRQALAQVGIRLGSEQPTPKELQQIMAQLAERDDAWLYQMLVLRSLAQAAYDPRNVGHYGLALPKYMHFTSPIRRYADLLVHRAIKDVLQRRPRPETADTEMQRLAETGAHISYTERRAEELSRAVADWLKCEYATRFVGDTFGARITGVTDFGLFAELDDIYVSGLVHISNLGNDYYRFEPTTMTLVGDRTGMGFRLGDRVRVVLAAVDLESRKVDLLLAQEDEGGRSPKSRRRGRRRPAQS